jgi:FAD:protein FMN transferase
VTSSEGSIIHAEDVMGTVVSLHVHEIGDSRAAVDAAIRRACDRLHELDDLFSTWKPHSPMNRLRAGRMAWDDAPREIMEVLSLCDEVKALTAGWFDPWAMPGGVDPTGLVKGWAVEQAREILRRGGVQTAMINGGGDVALLGTTPTRRWRIGIRHPWRVDALACVLEVEHAVATSGSYERGGHLVSPKVGAMPAAVASATVVGPSLAVADGLATALAVGGDDVFDAIRGLDGYDAYRIMADGTEEHTEGIAFA